MIDDFLKDLNALPFDQRRDAIETRLIEVSKLPLTEKSLVFSSIHRSLADLDDLSVHEFFLEYLLCNEIACIDAHIFGYCWCLLQTSYCQTILPKFYDRYSTLTQFDFHESYLEFDRNLHRIEADILVSQLSGDLEALSKIESVLAILEGPELSRLASTFIDAGGGDDKLRATRKRRLRKWLRG